MNQPKLIIRLLGGLTMTQQGTAVTGFASRKAEALFIYLACHRRPHPRETLAALFWPDNDQTRALANLSVVLTSLRKQLADYLTAERHTVFFQAEAPFWLDVEQFEQALRQAEVQRQNSSKISRTVAVQLATAVSLYHGDFLAGFNVRGVPEFEAWVLLEQERLRQLAIGALADLISFQQQRGQLSEGIQYAQRLLALDSLQEETHRQLMRLYALDNQRAAALAQYEQCAAILAEELGVEPDEETTALYEQIRDDGLAGQQADPAQTATPQPPRHNLPAPATTFIGRADELMHVDRWLAEPIGHLLTIVGPGGMGKTRLAQEVARAHLGEFADGVWLVSLTPLQDLNDLATAVADTLGLSLSGKGDMPTQLLNRLKPLEMLLVLDNLEHLLSPELRSFLSQLTQAAPELRLIITSRERLRLQAETLLELHGLPFPENGNPYSVTRDPIADSRLPISDYPAVALFTNRARRIQADFHLDGQVTAVVQLCQLVGGLPLALEMAATWTRVLPVAEIVAEIQRGLDVLTTTLHDVPVRHRSLRAVIESSWRLLPAGEQALFRKLAVFRGGFTRAAAQQVAGATPLQLMSLTDRSFLRFDADQRFRRHPLLLQFAQEQLADRPDEQAETAAAHARFFAGFVQMQEAALKGADGAQALAALAADWENVRAAWQWGLAALDTAVLDPLVMGIGRFFASRGRPLEGALLFAAGLRSVQTWPETAVLVRLVANMQVELGYFYDQTGRLAEAEAVLVEADERTRRHQLTTTRINCLRILGVVSDHQGKRDAARFYLEEAYQLCQTYGEADQMLPILNALGNLCVTAAEFDQARAYFEEAMTLAASLGNTLRMAVLHGNIAIIANRQKNYEEAIQQWQQAQQGFREHNHETGLANTIFNIAMALHGLGKYDEALANIQKAHALLEKLGQRQGMAAGLGVMGMIYHKLGKRRAARRHLHDSLLLSQEIGSDGLAISGLAEIAELEMSGGNLEQAVFLLLFIWNHPATGGTTRQNTQRLLDELRAELPPQMMADVETAVAHLTLDALIMQLTRSVK